MMNLDNILMRRYATKKFDPTRRLSDEMIAQVKALLRYSPSSVNSQPWHFLITDTTEGKARIAQAAEGPYAANHSKISDAALVVVFCSKTDLSEEHLSKVLEQEAEDGRFPTAESREMASKTRAFYADLHRNQLQDTVCWMQKQTYLNLGNLLLGAGVLGIDAVPIEGVDLTVLDQAFTLAPQGLTAVAVVALGYAAEDDFNAQLPKSRFSEKDLFTCF